MGKTKQNGILHKLRRGIMCGALSCVLALGAVLTMPGMTARASFTGVVDNIKYKFDETNNTCEVKGFDDESKVGEEIHIPAKVYYNQQEYNVVALGSYSLSRNSNDPNIEKSIKLEEGLIEIGDRAFNGAGITEIEIPASVEFIYGGAFENCKQLKKIRFRGTTPPGCNNFWLEGVADGIIIEIPDGQDEEKWSKKLSLDDHSYSSLNYSIKTYIPTSTSSSSSTTSSPNQEENNNGEVEFIEEEPVNRIPAHVCQYEWEVVREVSADQDGLEQYLCKLCGNVQSTLTIPASQYQVQELYTKVTGAAEGETVIYDTGMIHTVCDKLFTKLQQRKDITLVITYQYKGENYRTTFPAGADYTELLQDADQFYGMLGLNGRCGIVTEKN